MTKDLGLMVFMVGIGLSAGSNLFDSLSQVGLAVFSASLMVSVIPVVLAYLFGATYSR